MAIRRKVLGGDSHSEAAFPACSGYAQADNPLHLPTAPCRDHRNLSRTSFTAILVSEAILPSFLQVQQPSSLPQVG